MAVWSEVAVRDVERTMRFDAEYYQPKFLKYEAQANRTGGLLSLFIANIIQPTEFIREYVSDDEDGAAIFWRAQNVRAGYVETENVEHIDAATFASIPTSHVKEGDILITRTGANAGDCATVPEGVENVAVSSHTLRLIPQSVELGYVIGTFFASDLGRDVLFRTVSGSSRPQITKEMLNAIRVPDFSEIAHEVMADIRTVYAKRIEAKTIYAEAENLLLHELGLDTLDLSHELTYERDFAEVVAADRFDAQFFAPRYQRAMAIMRRDKRTIGDVAPLSKRFFRPSPNEPFDYIEIGNLTGNGHAESEPLMGADAPSRAQWVVHENDVITSTVRPIRRLTALIEPSQNEFVCSSGFVVLEPQSIAPEVLTVYLRLPIVCEILDLHTTATMYPAIATETLLSIPISQPSEAATNEIINKVRESRRAREDAKQLLEDAKRKVEGLILGEEAKRVS